MIASSTPSLRASAECDERQYGVELSVDTSTMHSSLSACGSVPQALKELCIVLVSTLNSTPYCLSSHSALARRLGVDDAIIASIRDYASNPRLGPAEKAALAVAESITRDPTHL